jgi:putative ABC transport system permease protein
MSNLNIRNYNEDVYAPIQTLMIRFSNRSLVTKAMLESANQMNDDEGETKEEATPYSPHQIDRLVVQMKDATPLDSAANLINRLMIRRHNRVADIDISVSIYCL